jgi:hypothetical protein
VGGARDVRRPHARLRERKLETIFGTVNGDADGILGTRRGDAVPEGRGAELAVGAVHAKGAPIRARQYRFTDDERFQGRCSEFLGHGRMKLSSQVAIDRRHYSGDVTQVPGSVLRTRRRGLAGAPHALVDRARPPQQYPWSVNHPPRGGRQEKQIRHMITCSHETARWKGPFFEIAITYLAFRSAVRRCRCSLVISARGRRYGSTAKTTKTCPKLRPTQLDAGRGR